MTTEEAKEEQSSMAKAVAEAVVAKEDVNPTSDAVMTDPSSPVKKGADEVDSKKEDVKPEEPSAVKSEGEQSTKDETDTTSDLPKDLPKNRFELELEFVQSLASPAYLHYLATNASSDDHNWLDDPDFVEYLRYLLGVWSKPEYNRFLVYPQALYFLEWMLNHRREEWAQVGFRNFAHQQQFMSWQHRASRLYGRGATKPVVTPPPDAEQQQQQAGPTLDPNTGLEVSQPEAMKEG